MNLTRIGTAPERSGTRRRFASPRGGRLAVSMTLLVVIALLAAACGDDSGSEDSSDALPGTSWRVSSLGGDPVVEGSILTLELGESGGVSGTTGCNSFNGPYEIDGDTISIGPLATTLTLCADEDLADQEQTYTAALEGAETFEVADEVLTLIDGDGNTLAELDQFDASLPGSSWTALSYNNGREAVVSLIIGTEITADFGTDGTLAGNGGCNDYSGTYEVDDDSISIGAITATERACVEPEGANEQEQEYLAALETAATWSLVGVNLELRTAEGALAATFAPAA